MSIKNILVVAAQEEELAPFFNNQISEIEKNTYLSTEIKGKTVYGLLGGIGKTSMALQLGLFLSNINIDLIINIGVCGTVSKSLKPFDILVATKSCYHDVDVTAFNHPYGQMCDEPLYYECYKKGINTINSYKNEKVKIGLILSGDKFVTKNNFDKSILKKFDNPIAIDMESATVGQVANDLKIPNLIIRAVSDDTDNEENKEDYDKQLNEAAIQASELALRLVIDIY